MMHSTASQLAPVHVVHVEFCPPQNVTRAVQVHGVILSIKKNMVENAVEYSR